MEAGDRTRDFAQENIALQSRATNTATTQPSPVPQDRNNNLLRPDQQLRPTLRPQTSRPSIRISRLPSAQNVPRTRPQPETTGPTASDSLQQAGRRRSSSDPQRTSWPRRNDDGLTRSATRTSYMEPVEEESSRTRATHSEALTPETTAPTSSGLNVPAPDTMSIPPGMFRRASLAVGSAMGFGGKRNSTATDGPAPPTIEQNDEYESQLVDILDVVGP